MQVLTNPQRFNYFYREYDEFVYAVTAHPDVSGHPHALLMLERLVFLHFTSTLAQTAHHSRVIEYINTKEGVEWVKMEEICDTFKSKNKPPEGALLPAAPGAIFANPDLQLERYAE